MIFINGSHGTIHADHTGAVLHIFDSNGDACMDYDGTHIVAIDVAEFEAHYGEGLTDSDILDVGYWALNEVDEREYTPPEPLHRAHVAAVTLLVKGDVTMCLNEYDS